MKYLLSYQTADGVTPDQLAAHFPAHKERWSAFRDEGTLLMIGPFTDRSGALAVFTTEGAARDFAATDPFVTEGLVGRWWIQEWMEALVPEG